MNQEPFSHVCCGLLNLSMMNERYLSWKSISQLLIPSEFSRWTKPFYSPFQYQFKFEDDHDWMILHSSKLFVVIKAFFISWNNLLYFNDSQQPKKSNLHPFDLNENQNNCSTPILKLFPSIQFRNGFFPILYYWLFFVLN